MAALIIIPIFGIIFFHSQIGQKNIDISIRANELKYFVDSIEADLNRFIEITGKRALISAVSNITVSGIPLDDAQIRLKELIENGTLRGVPSPLVDTDNLNTWEGKIGTISSNSGFDLLLNNIEMNVTQNDSFNVLFEIRVLVNISDQNVKMGILRNVSATSIVSIDGLEDPIFPLNTLGRVFRVIRYYNFTNYSKDLVQGSIAGIGSVSGNATTSTLSPNSQKIFITNNMSQDLGILNQFGGIVSESNFVPANLIIPFIAGASNALTAIQENQRIYLDFATKKVWDLKNLTSAIQNGYYRPSDDGASFLDRLEGRLTLSSKYKYGLESFVYLPDLTNASLKIKSGNSVLDHSYWRNITGSPIRNGNYDPVFNWFKIDSNNANIYGVNQLI